MIVTLVPLPHHPLHHHSPAVRGPASILLRNGTLADLESILEVGLAAMPMDPQWDYRFPHRRAFPQSQRDATKERYREFLVNNEGKWSVAVAEIMDNDGPRIVAFAVWDMSNVITRIDLDVPVLKSAKITRRDGDPKRMEAWKRILKEAKAKHFDRDYGTNHIQLQILATHPSYQRLGAGTRLVGDGIRLARASNKAISVFASPMGKRLYSRLGFESIDTVVIRVQGEDEFVTVEAMIYGSSSGLEQP